MRRTAALVCLVLLLVLLAPTVHAQSGAGPTSLQQMPAARACGMGGAHVAMVDDATALWWNPGALGFMRLRSVDWTYGKLFPSLSDDVWYQYLTASIPVSKTLGLALGFPHVSFGKQLATDFSGNVVGEFTPYEIAPSFAFGGQLTPRIGLGGAMKIVRVDLAPAAVTRDGEAGLGHAVAFDVGLLVRVPEQRLNIGVSFQNLGSNVEFEDADQSDPLPRNLKAGIAWWAVYETGMALILAADLNKPFVHWDDGPILNLGAEVTARWVDVDVSGRFGWVYEGWFQAIEPINGPSFGAGIRLWWVHFDYADMPQPPDLNRRKRISLGARF